MATQSLIIANTSPTVEVYRITDGANTYILAQDGYSANGPNTVSIQVDYSPYLERIATSLETIASEVATANSSYTMAEGIIGIWTAINLMRLDVAELTAEANVGNQYMKVVSENFEVERAINVSDLKYSNFNDDDFDQLAAVEQEVKNPTNLKD